MDPGRTGARPDGRDGDRALPRPSLADQMAELSPRLVGFAYSLTRDREEAADLAQEAMARALGARRRFTPGTNLKAWLFRILRNLHLNRLRQAARTPDAISIEELPAEPAATGRALRSAEHEAVSTRTWPRSWRRSAACPRPTPRRSGSPRSRSCPTRRRPRSCASRWAP